MDGKAPEISVNAGFNLPVGWRGVLYIRLLIGMNCPASALPVNEGCGSQAAGCSLGTRVRVLLSCAAVLGCGPGQLAVPVDGLFEAGAKIHHRGVANQILGQRNISQ